MNAVATISYSEVERLAVSIARSGLFGIKTPDQAIVLMMIAQAEGRHPALAARDYDVIQGRPSKKAEAMLRDFLEAGGHVEWHKLSDEVADATFTHKQGGSARITWDMKRASNAGLGGKDNWRKFPRQMLRSRVVSEGVRTVWPMATSGLYVPEETADFTGPTLETQAEAPPVTVAPSLREQLNADVPLESTPAKPRTQRDFLNGLRISMRECGSIGAVNRLISHPETQRALQTFKNGNKAELDGIIAEGIGAHAPLTPWDEVAENAWPGPAPADAEHEREDA